MTSETTAMGHASSSLEWAIQIIQTSLAGPAAEHMCFRSTVEEIVAHHEAGHAVASFLLGRRFAEISIVPRPDSNGRVIYNRGTPGDSAPIQPDREIADSFGCVAAVDVSEIERATRTTIADHWPMVRRLADELIERKVLSGRRARQILYKAQRKEMRRARPSVPTLMRQFSWS